MRHLLHLITLFLVCIPVFGGNSRIIIPANNQELEGFLSIDAPQETDSIIDFSEIAKYGDPIKWLYILSGDTAIIEHRGTSWRKFGLTSDTVSLTHSEDYRERSDFDIRLPILSRFDSVNGPYHAKTRRDMTFCYTDSGYVRTRNTTAGILILADSDTLSSHMCLETEKTFIRRSADTGKHLGTITETERRWHYPGSILPLASVLARKIEVEGRQPLTSVESVVFPCALNGISDTDGQTRSLADGSYENIQAYGHLTLGDCVSPTVNIIGSELTVSSSTGAEITVCDVAGRIWRTVKADEVETVIPISGLPGGEYVVSVKTADTMTSTTVHIP